VEEFEAKFLEQSRCSRAVSRDYDSISQAGKAIGTNACRESQK